MLEWFKERKYFLFIGAIIAILLIYYFMSPLSKPSSLDDESNWTEEIAEDTIIEPPNPSVEEDILVDVKGAVNSPGVYKAVMGDRVIDLIEKAGGAKETANVSAINFAERVTDEMVLYVPTIGEELEVFEGQGAASTLNESDSDKINLNKAMQTELETLPGIGPAKAQTIIEYRETNGSFKSIEDIKSISGFGEKTFEKLKDHIKVK